MLRTFGSITPYFRFKPKEVNIDNLAFKLHYRWSFVILLVSTILVSSRQYIGDHIHCIVDSGVPASVIDSFCFFTSTFTLVRLLNTTAVELGAIPHAGIGPLAYQEETVKRHAYYQWVPFVLFVQAIFFYLPHYVWKIWEGGTIKILVNGLKMISISKYMDKDSLRISGREFPSKKVAIRRVHHIKLTFKNRLSANKWWGRKLIFCELLNFMNVLVQIYFTNRFLGGQFYELGVNVWNESWTREMDSLDVIFPKITKCHFHKYGPSGSIQLHDSLCVMALNVINEKIFTFLWFWFIFLFFISFLALLWRVLTVMLHKSLLFNFRIFSIVGLSQLNKQYFKRIIRKCDFSDWMFLYFLATNTDEYVFKELLKELAEEFSEEVEEMDESEQQHLENSNNEKNENVQNHQIDEEKIDQENKERLILLSIDTVDSGGVEKDKNKIN